MREPASKAKVLVVEDDSAIRDALRELLEDEGYEVLWAANGLEALARLKGGHAPRLILLDLTMPVMDGWEFRHAQRRDPALALIPVVVISAEHGVEAKLRTLEPDGFLPKPFAPAALLDTVHRYC